MNRHALYMSEGPSCVLVRRHELLVEHVFVLMSRVGRAQFLIFMERWLWCCFLFLINITWVLELILIWARVGGVGVLQAFRGLTGRGGRSLSRKSV